MSLKHYWIMVSCIFYCYQSVVFKVDQRPLLSVSMHPHLHCKATKGPHFLVIRVFFYQHSFPSVHLNYNYNVVEK